MEEISIGTFCFKRNQPSKNLLVNYKKVCPIPVRVNYLTIFIKILVINFQQVCYILKFKNNQELYVCITSLANELKKNFQEFCTLFQNFSLRRTFEIPAKRTLS